MQNQQIQQSEEKKASIDWNKWDLILIALSVTFIILIPLGWIYYLSGRYSFYLIILTVWIAYSVIGVFTIIFIFAIRSVTNWTKLTRKKKLTIAIQIGMLMVFVVLFFVHFFCSYRIRLLGTWL